MAIEHESDSALADAVRKAGSQTAFGRIVGKNQSVIHDWLRESRPLPAELVLLVERQLGVSRHDLRPDLYPREDSPAHPSAHQASQDPADGSRGEREGAAA